MHHCLRKLLISTEGAVMVEATVMLPIFVVILAALIYFHRTDMAKLQNNNKARSCAWTYSINGCQRSQMPPECKIGPVRTGFSSIGDSLGNQDLKSATSAFGSAGNASSSGDPSTVTNGIAGANRIALALLGLGEGIVAEPTKSVKRPSLFGGGAKNIMSNYTVMCNERNMTIADILHASYCEIGNSLPGCPKKD